MQGNDDIEDEPEALNMSWPKTNKKRLTYLLVAPILVPLWLTLPDTKTPRGKKYYPVTFIGSIVWIAAYSYLMVWWANVAGETAKIPPEVSGRRERRKRQGWELTLLFCSFSGDGSDVLGSWHLHS